MHIRIGFIYGYVTKIHIHADLYWLKRHFRVNMCPVFVLADVYHTQPCRGLLWKEQVTVSDAFTDRMAAGFVHIKRSMRASECVVMFITE